MHAKTWVVAALALALGAACTRSEPAAGPAGAGGPDVAQPPAAAPAAKPFRVAFVYVGPVGDGGWTFAHDAGRKHLEQHVPGVVTKAFESVAEGAEAEALVRSLARDGYDLVVTTSFGFMDATAQVASEFPATRFVHVSGFRKNERNLANLMGAMECMRYLAGVIAGARAAADGQKTLGAVEPFPIPEVVRLLNAFALGVRRSCPACTIQLRWIHSWFDPVKEKEAAQSLLAGGAYVVVTGADTPGPVVAAAAAGRWGIGYDSQNACEAAPERCLTTTYWNWGPTYQRIVEQIRAGTWKPGDLYPDADSELVGLLGFEPGQTPHPGIPAAAVAEVRDLREKMRRGELDRFGVFSGPIRDNQGRLVVPEGKRLTQEDLEGLKGVPGRLDCTTCMGWLADGIEGSLPSGGH
ncbi:MAG TPA: BMP family ABC transporter substrate-binding protein [Myxococcota bacterium]|nr:BMP family ABC transporter substrate-binding protein [Myxococcota bacterium]HRY92987.1 BMP family ABC transporter substrate-binding protein [Myxococcota bacterium]HSA19903.1 BMP family ABC transporter substrate-binding protein [Myxococcota bacterium]